MSHSPCLRASAAADFFPPRLASTLQTLLPSNLSMLRDVRFAFRQLRRTPGFALVAVLTFALGIGANTAVFSVMNAVVLRFLPVSHPERLVFLHTSGQPSNSSQ